MNTKSCDTFETFDILQLTYVQSEGLTGYRLIVLGENTEHVHGRSRLSMLQTSS